ncbi:MAG TPA: rod shape-determining protein MreC [Candidatus Paceibacterota bacterium]
MNYLLRSKPKSFGHRKMIFTIVLFMLLSFSGFLFMGYLRSFFYTVSRPIWIIGNTSAKPFIYAKDFFVFKSRLITDNLAIKEELSNLRMKEIDYDALLKENLELKEELGRKISTSRVMARILSKPPQSPYDTFVVDAGSSDGVVLGNKVYLSDVTIIGIVTNITPHTSLVRLFSSSGVAEQMTLSRTGASFTITGAGGANMKLEVPKETDILWGDVFMYPGIASSIIGSVYYIDTNSQSSFKTVYIRSLGNVFSAKSVFIEKTK